MHDVITVLGLTVKVEGKLDIGDMQMKENIQEQSKEIALIFLDTLTR